jgi:hypothetical protein
MIDYVFQRAPQICLTSAKRKTGKKKIPSISNHRILFYIFKNIYKFFLKFFNYTNWKIIAIEMKRIIIFGPFFTRSAHFDSPKDEFFAVPTFIFLKISKKNHVTYLCTQF